ncbi:hypothetical protein HDU96_007754 [Phlyctochytrium bullatum]|nr:hypothetical protein HDU96_007754 [Phlyctochytrium bullatum]
MSTAETPTNRVYSELPSSNMDLNNAHTAANPTTALHDAASRNDAPEILRLLLAGADPTAATTALQKSTSLSVWTVFADFMPIPTLTLLTAAQAGDGIAVRLLLARGVDPLEKGPNDMTALHYAVAADHRDVVFALLLHPSHNRLLAATATTTPLPTSSSLSLLAPEMTPLHLAAQHHHTAVARALLRSRAPVADDDWEKTPLHVAASEGAVGVARVVLEHGADPNARDYRRRTALHRAALADHPKMCRVLVEAGAEVEARDEEGWTALGVAAGNGGCGAVRVLVEMGAEREVRTGDGRTAGEVARERGFGEVVKVLVPGVGLRRSKRVKGRGVKI